ncbi:diadenosine tetraphosphate (Ap4A) hydrolase and other HIT family hydrolases [Vibrio maritimus]|uniref:Diadenosine tetraphosphate (Ap4A) hydrolase and other HIT family hydrolases n=1 Tax=Vibrio maritimus TaxID=990268 RepID=A0A090S4K6_9VIBR|nr:diadenosine tetraphosphate (Ap4A) hydrolase and other HIT family hydrolases [Vibrio maritimus]
MSFELHPQLTKDTSLLGDFPLSLALLHKDDSVPWIILVPKKADLTELHHLSMPEQQQFLLESEVVNRALETLFTPDKLNFGALGNMVPQLHVHHIARFKNDIAWPGPLWGSTKGEYRSDADQQSLVQRIQSQLAESELFKSA